MKVCIYTICKDESKHVKQFMACVKEADGIFITDTGSTDNTVQLLRDEGAIVQEVVVDPWRFDRARNISLDFVPEDFDICLSIDLDEILTPGWCEAIKKSWTGDTNRLRYKYVWSHNSDGSDGTTFWYDKCHSRFGYRWEKPVHETLMCLLKTGQHQSYCSDFTLHHYPDPTKSRASYLSLLEMACKENPDDDRSSHYLGREYMYRGMYEESIVELRRHLALSTSQWEPERSASMRFISQGYKNLGDDDNYSIRWALRAAAEAPTEREPWINLGKLYFQLDDYAGCYFAMTRAIAITERPLSYICEPESWGTIPYDLGGLSSYYLGMFQQAFDLISKALEMEPNDIRLRQNLHFAATMIK